MPGLALPSTVISISTRLAVALGLTVCDATLTGRISFGSGSKSLPSMTRVVLWPIVRPRSDTLLIVGAAKAAAGSQERSKSEQARLVRRVIGRLRVKSSFTVRWENAATPGVG